MQVAKVGLATAAATEVGAVTISGVLGGLPAGAALPEAGIISVGLGAYMLARAVAVSPVLAVGAVSVGVVAAIITWAPWD